MDPNANPTIDPKLKETYDRVMNTQVPPAADPQSQTVTPPPFTPPPPPQSTPSQQPDPAVLSPQQTTPIQSEPTTTVQATMPIAIKPAGSAVIVGASPKKSGGKLFALLFALGGLILLGVYTVFWIKFFNLKVSFLPF